MRLDILKTLQKLHVIPITNNQNVITCKDNEGTRYYIFYSYQSLIAIYCDGELMVNIDKWDYSKTTMKWFNYFLNNFTSYYFTSNGFKCSFTQALMSNDRITIFHSN